AARVLGDIHGFKAQRHRVFYRLLGGLEQEIVSPTLGVAADWAGTDEGRRLDVEPGTLHDFGDRPNVILMGAGCAVGLNLHLVADDLVSQGFTVSHGTRPRTG